MPAAAPVAARYGLRVLARLAAAGAQALKRLRVSANATQNATTA